MRQRRIAAAVKPPNGIVSNCDVCGGLMFNAQSYMHTNDAYFAPTTIRFPHELKKIFNEICSTLIKCIHITLHWIWTSCIGYSSIERAVVTPFPLPMQNSSICLIHWVFCGFIMIVLHICYISWRISSMDCLMIVHDNYAQQLLLLLLLLLLLPPLLPLLLPLLPLLLPLPLLLLLPPLLPLPLHYYYHHYYYYYYFIRGCDWYQSTIQHGTSNCSKCV